MRIACVGLVLLAGCSIPSSLRVQESKNAPYNTYDSTLWQLQAMEKSAPEEDAAWRRLIALHHEVVREVESDLKAWRDQKNRIEAELVSLLDKEQKSGADLLRIDDLKLERRALLDGESARLATREAVLEDRQRKLKEAEEDMARKVKLRNNWMATFRQRLKELRPDTPSEKGVSP